MKLSDLTAGCEVCVDAGFTCLSPGIHKVDVSDDGAFILCDEGKHYLEGQEGDDGELIGIRGPVEVTSYGYRVPKTVPRS